MSVYKFFFFFSSRRRHTRLTCDWSSDVCSSDLGRVRPDGRAVLVDIAPLADPRFRFAGNDLRARDRGRFHVVQVDDVEVRLLQQLFLGVTEQAAKRTVGAQKAAAYREEREAHSAVLIQGAESCAAR